MKKYLLPTLALFIIGSANASESDINHIMKNLTYKLNLCINHIEQNQIIDPVVQENCLNLKKRYNVAVSTGDTDNALYFIYQMIDTIENNSSLSFYQAIIKQILIPIGHLAPSNDDVKIPVYKLGNEFVCPLNGQWFFVNGLVYSSNQTLTKNLETTRKILPASHVKTSYPQYRKINGILVNIGSGTSPSIEGPTTQNPDEGYKLLRDNHTVLPSKIVQLHPDGSITIFRDFNKEPLTKNEFI